MRKTLDTTSIAGELDGNVEEASRVDLLQTGAMTGDLKAGLLTGAAGARMRGQAAFSVDDKDQKPGNGILHGRDANSSESA